MDLRPYRPEDKEGLLTAFDSNVPDWFYPEEREKLDTYLDTLPGPYAVLDHDGTIVGGAGYSMCTPDMAELRWLIVRRDLHGNGLGKLLVYSTLRELSKRENPPQVSLRTLPQATGFFEKMGFHVVSNTPWVDMVKKLKVCP